MRDKSSVMLASLLNRGHKPEFYTVLEPEMFKEEVDRKIIKALKEGFRFSPNNIESLREVAGLSYTETAGILVRIGEPTSWVTEQDIVSFVEEYNKRKVKEYLQEGDVEKALEYTKKIVGRQVGIVEDYRRHLQDNRSGADAGLLGLPTGIPDLDRVTSGFRKSKVWIVGGYNAYGKSYFLTNMVNRLIGMGRRVCVVTLEMTKEDILDRVIGERLNIGVYELAKSVNKSSVEEQIENIDEHIKNLDLCILDSIYDINDILRKVKIEHKNRAIDVLFLDFIQLVRDKEAKTNYESLSSISTKLQSLTKELGLCSVLLSQISNEAQKDGDFTTYGFKGAGEIGQVADIAIRILREKENGKFTEDYTLDVMKNRSGQTGQVLCRITFPSGSITQKRVGEVSNFSKGGDYGLGDI